MANRLAALLLIAILTGCSSLPLGFLGGGGPNVAANTQIGKENRQTAVGFEQKTEVGRDLIQKDVSAESVGTVTINNITMPWWVVIAGFWFFFMWSYLLWRLPAPEQIWRKEK